MSGHDVHVFSRDEIISGTQTPVSRTIRTLCLALTLIGAAVFIFGAFTGVDRAWQALHVNWLFFTSVSSAAVVIVAVQRITTSRWSRPIVRILEGFVAFLPVALVLLVLILLVGKTSIFPWAVKTPSIAEKARYLQVPYAIARNLGMFTIITILSVWYVYTSVRLDVGITPEGGAGWAAGLRRRMRTGFRDERREIHSTHSTQGKLAVWLTIAFGIFWCVIAWDLSMALDLYFHSVIYGWWFFMGAWLVAIAAWTLLAMAWRKHLNRYDMITDSHFHDLGKLCFGFTAFWGYLTFSQFLIIWYANLGEETHWMRLRLIDPWWKVSILVVFLMFVIPFFGLLSRKVKLYVPTMSFFAICIVVGLWFHRYIEVYPSLHGDLSGGGSLPLGIWELGVTLGMLGLWGFCYTSFMDAFPRMRVMLMTSPHRDEVQVPCNPETMEPLPAHE